MSGRGADGRGRGSGSGGRGGGGRGQQPAGRGQPQPSRGGGSSGGVGRGRGANAPPPQSLAASAAPLQQSPMTRVTSLSHEMEQKLTLQASSSTAVPAPRPQVQAPRPQVPAPPTQVPAPPTQVPVVVAVNPPQTQLPPASSKAVRIPARPGLGTFGQKTIVKANHFLVSVADRDLNHYDVAIVPEVASKKVCRMIMNQLVKLFHVSHLGKRKLAYDGRKSCYTAGPLPFTSKDFVVKLDDDRRDREFKVTIRFASKADLHHLREFLQGRQRDIPHETIQFLDVVLREKPSNSYEAVGRSFFHPEFEAGELGNGLEYWKGFYQSLRPTQIGLSLNIDMSARAFFEPILVTEFVSKYLNRDLNRPLSDQERIKLKRALKGVKVENNHQGHIKHFKISGVSIEPTQRLMFPVDESGAQISVFQYFRQKYNIVLKFPHLPAIQAGSSARPAYLPMELCKIVEGQRYSKKLNERQVTQLLRATCKRPEEREKIILKMVEKNNYNRDELVNTEFGIQVRPELMSIDARVLPPPMLKYHDSGKEKRVQPNVGQWNMMNKKMVNGGNVEFWTCINFSRCRPEVVETFCDQLITMCCNKGMEFGPNPLVPIRSGHSGQIEKSLKGLHSECLKTGKQLQLLLIILPDVTGSYGLIKRVCETELGIVSQCCQPKQASKCNIQYLENVSLKINVKAGGRNTMLEQAFYGKMPYLSERPTIIFGADVTHPQPGEDSSPSIAAVVASMDWPEVTKYRGLVSAQAHREEIIQDLYTSYQDPAKGLVHAGLIRDHLLAFYKSTKTKPHRIIFYRDGVSEGQFNQVLLYEIDAIRKACSSLQADYQPKITFVVVQKRHHTRLFPADHRNRSTSDRSGNILPGTVVDTKICHPNEFDFYLCSHSGIQGTSRPAHYHVLYDENCFTADGLQILTNSLCYTYARCTRSVSIVPPAYYAHLAAFRARYYIEGGEFSDSESASAAPGGATRERVGEIRSLPAIKENVKDVMFFC